MVAIVSSKAAVALFIAFLWGVSASGAVMACNGSLGRAFTRMTYGVVKSTVIWALRTGRAADAIVSPHVGLVVTSRAHVGLRDGRWAIVTHKAAVHRGAAFLAVFTFRADFERGVAPSVGVRATGAKSRRVNAASAVRTSRACSGFNGVFTAIATSRASVASGLLSGTSVCSTWADS